MNKTAYHLVTLLAVGTLLAVTSSLGTDKRKLAEMKLREVTPDEGFAYFSGWNDTNAVPWNHITVYSYKNISDESKVRIVGNKVNVDFPVSKIDDALRIYKIWVLQKVEKNQKELERLNRELEELLPHAEPRK